MTNPMDVSALDERAREILRLNDRGGYTVPTDGLYPYQWNWDSMFAALGFATFDLDRAWTEVETLLSGQWPNGMIPHILFHKPDPGYFPGPDVWGTGGRGPIPSSGVSQPPVAATIVRQLYERAPDRKEPLQAWDKLVAWHRWFMEWRTEGGAVCVTHPWEAGRDNAVDWDGGMAAIDPSGVAPYTRRDTSHVDPSMRPTKEDYDRYIWLVERARARGWDEARICEDAAFRVADPGLTFILLGATRDLVEMGRALGRDVAEAEAWIPRLEAGAASLWNPETGGYDSRDTLSGDFAGSLSNASYLCWFGGVESSGMRTHLARILDDVPWPVPSYDPSFPKFDSRRYWRGPTWAIVNNLIAIGLRRMGHLEEAERLRRSTAQMIAEHGFAEYFDPMTGAPAGGGTFTWTAAVWLAWASPSAQSGG